MFNRRDSLLLLGVVAIAIGGWLFLHPYQDEPLWTEWLLAPVLVFLGLVFGIVALTVHNFAETANTAASKNVPTAVKPNR